VTLPKKTLDDLEWERIVRAVSDRCTGPSAKGRAIEPSPDREGAKIALEETREAASLLAAGEQLPLDGLRDVWAHLDRLERQGALDGPALRDVLATMGAARVLRKFVTARRRQTPSLYQACATDPTLDSLEETLAPMFEPDGTVADHASPELKRLRTETANLRGRLVARLEELVQKHADILSDKYFTLREGRYVLPVRSDAHERFSGIVHATSASGATIFVEPRALVELGNRLKMAQGEMERELARIFAELSERVRDKLPALRAAAEALDRADMRHAGAVLGRDLAGSFCELAPQPDIALREARHPLLALDGVEVVANDLKLAGGHGLVLSGPNAGGKTVALKAMGLAALMVRAGLPLAAAEGSVCGFFDPVLTDVGDDQSLTRNLSTFSAHVANIASILRSAGAGSLVLLDELAGSTDPGEGAALACAVVDALCRHGAAVAVTTHYEPLKALALRDERMRNASVGFDVERMEPTFRLMLDVPGASSALVVAARFGMPAEVVEVARRELPEQSRSFDDIVRRLEEQWLALERAKAAVEEERAKASEARREAESALEAARRREKAVVGRESEQLVEAIKRARDEVRAARARIRATDASASEVEVASRQVDAAASKVAIGGELDPAAIAGPEDVAVDAPPLSALTVGARVYVPRLRTEADVVELPSRGRVRIAAGAMRLYVTVDEVRLATVRAVRGAPAPRTPAASPPRAPSTDDEQEGHEQTPENTIDVRGMRVDDALALIESFVDRLYGASSPVGYIVHGHGTGALRDAVRAHLKEARTYVSRSRPGGPEEGGERVTVVYIR